MKSFSRACVALVWPLCMIMTAPSASGWTTPIVISPNASGTPRVARGAGGSVHFVYATDWRVKYRFRSGAGQWSTIDTLADFFSFRPDVIEDAQNRPHVVYAGDGASGKYDLYHRHKSGGTWQTNRLTETGNTDEDQPRMAIDALGTIHLVYTRSTSNSNPIVYRTWNGTSWSPPLDISSAAASYDHRPDITIDPANNAHVIHSTDSALRYTKKTGTTWSSPRTIGTTADFCAFPKIAAGKNTDVMVVTFDQAYGIKYTVSHDAGANWSSLQNLQGGHWPNLDRDVQGNVHIAFHQYGCGCTGHRQWNGSNWSSPQPVGDTDDWQGWADVAVGTDGIVHVVHDSEGRVWYAASVADTFLPSAPTNLVATPGHWFVDLAWRNPPDPDFVGTTIQHQQLSADAHGGDARGNARRIAP